MHCTMRYSSGGSWQKWHLESTLIVHLLRGMGGLRVFKLLNCSHKRRRVVLLTEWPAYIYGLPGRWSIMAKWSSSIIMK